MIFCIWLIRELRQIISILYNSVSIKAYSVYRFVYRLLVIEVQFLKNELVAQTRKNNLTRNKLHCITYIVFFVSSDVCAKYDMSDTVYEAYDGKDMKPNDVTKLYRAEIRVKRSTYASFSLSYKSCQLTQKVLLGSWPGVSSNSLEFIRSYNYHLKR